MQYSREEIHVLQGQLQSSKALVDDLQKTVEKRDSKVETLRPKVNTQCSNLQVVQIL